MRKRRSAAVLMIFISILRHSRFISFTIQTVADTLRLHVSYLALKRFFLALAICSVAHSVTWAQADPKAATDPNVHTPPKLEKIEVNAPNEVEERRESTAAKIVIGRDEILRFGDTTI